jgi:hypothetical protein
MLSSLPFVSLNKQPTVDLDNEEMQDQGSDDNQQL